MGCREGRCVSLKPQGAVCFDSDGGKNADVAGYVEFEGSKLVDECATTATGETLVKEAVCTSDGRASWVQLGCIKGYQCVRGRCTAVARRRRAGVDFDDAFPEGFCGCGPKFPPDAQGSYFSLNNGATNLSESELEGLTRAQLGVLYFHPVADYFGRVGFRLHGISLENETEYAVTTETLGISVDSDNDRPKMSHGTTALSAAPGTAMRIDFGNLTIADSDALDSTFRATITTTSGVHRIWAANLAGCRLVNVAEDQRSEASASMLFLNEQKKPKNI